MFIRWKSYMVQNSYGEMLLSWECTKDSGGGLGGYRMYFQKSLVELKLSHYRPL